MSLSVFRAWRSVFLWEEPEGKFTYVDNSTVYEKAIADYGD